MRVALLTKEYPPDIYGGAGVHVANLVRWLRELIEVDVHCMGAPRPDAVAHVPDPALAGANAAVAALSANLTMVEACAGVDLVHSHTWYANLGGHLTALRHGIPHVLTAHSLEPRRPWKAEQLGGGYRLSSWIERTAYEAADAIIAVSDGMRADVLDCYPTVDPARVHVVRNGIDTAEYHPVHDPAVLAEYGIEADRPMVLFVGRITRQKGLDHLLAAAHAVDPAATLVFAAGAPDTPELGAQVAEAVRELAAARTGVHWIERMLPAEQLRALLTHATVFVCPSVYEPLGIVNLEAMACATAVVGSAVGGIPEVVAHGETGLLVAYDERDAAAFRAGLAAAINELVADPATAAAYGAAGRARAEREFSWGSVAERTVAVYRAALVGRTAA